MLALFFFAVTVSARVDPFWGSDGTEAPVSEGIARTWNWEKAQTGNIYPLAYEFNGCRLSEPRVKVAELERGGTLTFKLGDRLCYNVNSTREDL